MEEYKEKIEKFQKREAKVRYFSIALSFVPILIGSFWMYISYEKVKELEVVKENMLVEFKALDFEYNALNEKKAKLESELMENYGLSIDSITNLSTSAVLEASLAANSVIKDLSLNYRPKPNLVVRYYAKTIDEERVALSLKSLGYKFETKDPRSYMTKQQTNSVWFGSEVPLKDSKIIALTLIRAGVPIKAIRPYNASRNNPAYKSNIIEVGGDKALVGKEALTVDEVNDAEEFVRF